MPLYKTLDFHHMLKLTMWDSMQFIPKLKTNFYLKIVSLPLLSAPPHVGHGLPSMSYPYLLHLSSLSTSAHHYQLFYYNLVIYFKQNQPVIYIRIYI